MPYLSYYSSVNSGIFEYHISDHHPIFAVANLSVAKAAQSSHYTRRFFSVSKRSDFIDTLTKNLDDITFNHDEHPNINMNILVEVLQKSINTVFPLKRLSRKKQKQLRKPWITPVIVRSTLKCKALFKEFLRKKDVISHNAFKKYRNKLNRITESAKEMQDFDDFKKVENDIDKTWKLINQKSGRIKKSNKLPKTLKTPEGNLVANPKVIANFLNKHFVRKGVELANKIQTQTSNTNLATSLTPRVAETFIFKLIVVEEILKIINSLSLGKIVRQPDDLTLH